MTIAVDLGRKATKQTKKNNMQPDQLASGSSRFGSILISKQDVSSFSMVWVKRFTFYIIYRSSYVL